jgi:RNA polymerase sigma-70 factor (family 1)
MALEPVHTDQEKSQLIKLRAGDEKAFDYFYKLYSLPIYRKLLKMVKVEFLAEDLLQNVFIKLWDKRELIDPGYCLKGYLYQMAQNSVYDFYRSLAREEKLQVAVKNRMTELTTEVEEKLLFKETHDLLTNAIEQLPQQQQMVFKLCKLEGKSYEEVSELLGISTSTINGHIVKATKKVKMTLLASHDVAFLVFLAVLTKLK